MGLQFYFGASGSGKSTRVYEEILRRAKEHPEQNFLILVPDQFTMQTQKELVSLSPEKGIMNIDVLSFGRLSHRVFEEINGERRPMLDDTGKSLIVRRVAAQVKEQIPVIGGSINKTGYVHEVKSAISEFMQYGIGLKELEELTKFSEKRGQLYYKLKDLGVLYRGFLDYIRNTFLTVEESLELLGRLLPQSVLVRGSVVVFDGFTGFTPVQNKVIREIMLLASQVIVTVTMDEEKDCYSPGEEQELFYLSKKTVSSLLKIANEAGVKREQDVFLPPASKARFKDNPELAHLEKYLFRYPVKTFEKAEHIHLMEAASQREEVRQVCIAIKRLIREKGYSFRDIAVIAGDLETYVSLMEQEFETYRIPVYMDRTRGITLNPFIEYIKSALQIRIQNYSYESVFHYIRSGLADFTPEEADRLENYVLALGIRGRRKWNTMFVRKTEDMEKETEELAELNELRERLVSGLEPLFEDCRNTEELAESLYRFIVKSNVQQKLFVMEKEFEKEGDMIRAREYAQIYRFVMDLLNQIVELIGKEEIKPEEFARILEAGFEEIKVGTIPQNVDRVMVGDMERTRLKPVKALFFVGVNDGFIPKMSGKGGLISDLDREFLLGSELELAPAPRQQMYIQRLYLYLNLTKPSSELYLSFARMNAEGKSMRPSYLIESIKRLFPALTLEIPENLPVTEQIQAPEDARTWLVQGLRDFADGMYVCRREEEEEFFLLYRLLLQEPSTKEWTKKAEENAFYTYRKATLSKAVAAALYGQTLQGSVSRLEQYASCAYAHFLRYGLLLRERQGYEFEAVDLGNLYHAVLEMFAAKLTENHYTWFDFPEEEGERLIDEAVESFAVNYGNTILFDTSRNEYMITRMKRILKRTVKTLQYQLKQGSFLPEQFEVSFSVLEELDAVNIALSDREKMRLRGRIDRMDVCEDDKKVYVKVMDYKSGNREFSLAALYYGLQLQLVVYLNAAMEMEKKKHPEKEIVPAAMLYYRVNDPLIEGGKELSEEEINRQILKELRAAGVVNADEDVVKRLDGRPFDKSDVIPVERKKDGSFSSRSHVLESESFRVISDYVNLKIKNIGREILNGSIVINPYEQGNNSACEYCAYKKVCGFDGKIQGFENRELPKLEDEEAISKMKEALDKGSENA